MDSSLLKEDWEIALRFLPPGWEEAATELGALIRKRKIASANRLLHVLLFYLASGKSLRTVAAYSRETALCEVNDTALLYRLRGAEEWFHWLVVELFQSLRAPPGALPLPGGYRPLVVDGSFVQEPGSTGTDWRIHYCLDLRTLRCHQCQVTDPKIGETLANFTVAPGDLLIADRGYCHRQGMGTVVAAGGAVLVRYQYTNAPLERASGTPFDPLPLLRTLRPGVVGEWDVWFRWPEKDQRFKARLLGVRKSAEAAKRSREALLRAAKKHQRTVRPETLEHAEYFVCLTTVSRHAFSAETLLEFYRARWQIELVFKRLKGVVGLGHLPATDAASCRAWLYGKLVVALLMERLRQEAEFFSPWGYPLRNPRGGADPP